MGDGSDPYKLMGINPRAPARGLNKIRHKSNPGTSAERSLDKCIKCGKVLLFWEFYDSKYCKECAEKIGASKTKSHKKTKNNLSKSKSHKPLYYNITFGDELKEEPEKAQNNKNYNYSFLNSLNADLNDNNPDKRMDALEALCKTKDNEAFSILIEGLKNDDSNVRWKIARQLGHLKDERAVYPLIEALKDPDFIVRNNAVWSLGEIGDNKAIEPLNQALKDKNKHVKRSANIALNKINKIH